MGNIHGALLTIGEVLYITSHGKMRRSSMEATISQNFAGVCNLVLRQTESKEKLIRHAVITLLPRLAHFQPEAFVRRFADPAFTHLLGCLRDARLQTERGTAFAAVGRIALAVGNRLVSDELRPQLERIIAVVKDGLTVVHTSAGALGVTRTTRRPFVPEALSCIAMLARAVGPALMEYMHELLDPMFCDGLSPILTQSLQVVAGSIPALKPMLQERLLHELSIILSNTPFAPPTTTPMLTMLAGGSAFGPAAAARWEPAPAVDGIM
ncbi:MAG: hypothetical protein EOO41_00480, partial [Methanobacteriota archaeon]